MVGSDFILEWIEIRHVPFFYLILTRGDGYAAGCVGASRIDGGIRVSSVNKGKSRRGSETSLKSSPSSKDTVGTASTPPPRVFISYSHENDSHNAQVLELAGRLRSNGIDAWIDRYDPNPREGWPRWMTRQFKEADFVLVVCTETYCRRFDGLEENGRGRGATWEGHLANLVLYEDGTLNRNLVIVQFGDRQEAAIPSALRPYTSYLLPDEYETILRYLTKQPEIEAPPIGEIPDLGPKSDTMSPLLPKKALSEGGRKERSTPDTETRLQKAVNEMTTELTERPHLHWAFSVAWADAHPKYDGIGEGRFAEARDISEAFLASLRTYDACSLADLAHESLVKHKSLPHKALEDAEPAKDEMSRYKAASDMVDLILRFLSRRQYDGAAAALAGERNQEVTVRAKEESAAELCSSGLDERAPKFLPLEMGSSILRSEYQIPKAPPEGINFNGELSAQHVVEDLGKKLIPAYGTFHPGQPNDKLWETLNSELWHLCKKKTGEDRGRYFLVFSDAQDFDKNAEQVVILKDKLDWLRFFVLDPRGVDNDDSYRPLNDILLRHQQTKENLHSSSKE